MQGRRGDNVRDKVELRSHLRTAPVATGAEAPDLLSSVLVQATEPSGENPNSETERDPENECTQYEARERHEMQRCRSAGMKVQCANNDDGSNCAR